MLFFPLVLTMQPFDDIFGASATEYLTYRDNRPTQNAFQFSSKTQYVKEYLSFQESSGAPYTLVHLLDQSLCLCARLSVGQFNAKQTSHVTSTKMRNYMFTTTKKQFTISL